MLSVWSIKTSTYTVRNKFIFSIFVFMIIFCGGLIKAFREQQVAVLPFLWSAPPSSALREREILEEKSSFIQTLSDLTGMFLIYWYKIKPKFDKHSSKLRSMRKARVLTQALVALNPHRRWRDEAVRRRRGGRFWRFCQLLLALVLHRLLRVFVILVFVLLLWGREGGENKTCHSAEENGLKNKSTLRFPTVRLHLL